VTWPLVGHDWAKELLRDSLKAGRAAHAYLFTGPAQIGKTSLARTLAQALNCPQPDPPCGACPSCVKITQGVHPDVRVVAGQDAGASIKIDQVRALQREAILAPYEGRYRVYILRRIDQGTLEAANCLLKTLEEPPGHVVLVLTAINAQALPTTIVSRCQRLDLRLATQALVQQTLVERGVAQDQARLLARLSGGRIGWALDASQDEGILKRRQQSLDQLVQLLAAGRVERFDFAKKASRDPAGARSQIDVWTGWWRDLLLLSYQQTGDVVNVDRLDELCALSGQGAEHQIWVALKALQTATGHLEANVNARLALESLMLKLPRWHLPANS
jgi:DNA polymerase-3 subunit delta'